jgi:hypothetical protein
VKLIRFLFGPRIFGFSLLGEKVRHSFILNLFLFLGITAICYAAIIAQLRIKNEKQIIAKQLTELVLSKKINMQDIRCKNYLRTKIQRIDCIVLTKKHLVDIRCGQTYSASSGCKVYGVYKIIGEK